MVTDQEAGSAPLAGIRVLELGNFIAAPFAGMVFADFGADVIKIERPGSGDELRGWRALRGSTSMLFRTVARNKRSLTLNLSTEQGRAVVLELVARCDVVVENFRPGTLERWDLPRISSPRSTPISWWCGYPGTARPGRTGTVPASGVWPRRSVACGRSPAFRTFLRLGRRPASVTPSLGSTG